LKCDEQYDKLSCDLLEMWRVITRTCSGLQSHPNSHLYVGDSARKSSSSPTQNSGVVQLKNDTQVAYHIQLGLIFPIEPVPQQNVSRVDRNHQK
jgi:hypothetical protein